MKRRPKILWILLISIVIVVSFAAGSFVPMFVNRYNEKIKKEKLDPATISEKVTPQAGINLGVSFKDSVIKMVALGAIDKQKFEKLYKDREESLPKEIVSLFESPSDQPITINYDNANILLNILWPLGLSNKTEIMKDSPMGKEYAKDIENFAATGGWTLGKETGGKLFNSLSIITLNSEQEKVVAEIAQNIYRPCCGNSTYFPDCNHGAAMLGFLYLAASSNIPKDEIYQKALALNSYWFPQTYVELATYFQNNNNTSWEKVNAQQVLGNQYSSSQGYLAVNKKLQAEGLIPQVSGGGSCGV